MKVLIAYGTKYGSTAKIADYMKEAIEGAGQNVDVIDVRKEPGANLSEYPIVIVGSCIQFGKWMPEALDFLKRHESELSKKRVGLFVSCLDAFGVGDHKDARENYLCKVASSHPSIKPVGLGLFGGVIDMSKYGFATKLLAKARTKEMSDQGVDFSKPYDFRDWEEIQRWTLELIKRE